MTHEEKLYKNSPKSIKFFIYLFIIKVIIGFLDLSLQYIGITNNDFEFGTIGNFAFGTIVEIFFLFFILKRKNWSRIIFTNLTALTLFSLIFIVPEEIKGDFIGAVSTITQGLMYLFMVIILYVKQSNDWFKRKKEEY